MIEDATTTRSEQAAAHAQAAADLYTELAAEARAAGDDAEADLCDAYAAGCLTRPQHAA